MSDKDKKDINEYFESIKGMNKEELTAVKYFSLGIVAARELNKEEDTTAHE